MRLVAVALLVAVVAACGPGRAEFGDEQLSDVRGALGAGGLEICTETRDPDGLANEAIETRVYAVAIDCNAERVRLVVDRFDDADARDGAARQFEGLTRPRSDGVVWTWGPYTLFANGARDDDVMERLTTALDDAGAK
ncbi:MAG: hypothetical protein ACXW2Y_00180 [Acidimicrobiia bacterium]